MRVTQRKRQRHGIAKEGPRMTTTHPRTSGSQHHDQSFHNHSSPINALGPSCGQRSSETPHTARRQRQLDQHSGAMPNFTRDQHACKRDSAAVTQKTPYTRPVHSHTTFWPWKIGQHVKSIIAIASHAGPHALRPSRDAATPLHRSLRLREAAELGRRTCVGDCNSVACQHILSRGVGLARHLETLSASKVCSTEARVVPERDQEQGSMLKGPCPLAGFPSKLLCYMDKVTEARPRHASKQYDTQKWGRRWRIGLHLQPCQPSASTLA